MFHDVRENLDDNLGRLHDLRDKYENHDFLNESSELKKIFEDASEMLDNLNEEDILRPYKNFLDLIRSKLCSMRLRRDVCIDSIKFVIFRYISLYKREVYHGQRLNRSS